MTRQTKVWLGAVVILVVYVAAAIFAPRLVALQPKSATQLRIALIAIGFVAAALILWFLRQRGPSKLTALDGEIVSVLAAMREALKRSGLSKRGSLGHVPVVLVIGPEGSAKTTSVVRSTIGAELLAGDVFRGDAVAPTRTANVWLARKTAFVEAGGGLHADATAWKRLLRALRPRSLATAFGGGRQPPRYAIVCLACDDLVAAEAAVAVPATARLLRERLGEAARTFGIALPTYVFFTKADAIPHFEAYVHNLSSEEAREPLGWRVEPDAGGAGTYADRATAALQQSMEELFHSLALRRLDVLSLEHAVDWRPAAYELPRELRKLEPLAIDFLREIGRPSDLEASPVLRGAYFVGVQPVYVTEEAPQATAAPAAHASSVVRSATGVFNPAALRAAAAAATPAGQRTRKVPRWDFLDRLIGDVVLGDAVAAGMTRAGTRVSFWRRAAFGTLAIISVVLALGFTVSYRGNKAVELQTLTAAGGLAALPQNNIDLPGLDALARLDSLRGQVDTLSAYAHNGPPTRLRWGLYTGDALFPDVRRSYFAGFDKVMFGTTRNTMLASLRALPDAPRESDDYGEAYTLLKTYLITTTHPDKSEPGTLVPSLNKYWLAGRTLDAERAQLATKQFETYAAELRYANPYDATADVAAVTRARTFLRQFAGSERIYQFMIAEAAKATPSIHFNRQFPGSSRFVVDNYEVSGAFTKPGWTFMQTALKSVDRFLQGESWVVGDDKAPVDKAKLVAEMRDRYAADFVKAWRGYLQGAQVVRYGSVKDAADKLGALSGNQSPLLQLLALASRNTAVADSGIAKIFQPVHAVSPPDVTDKLIAPPNAPYIGALATLQASLEQTAGASGPGVESAAGQAASNAANARMAARQVAAGFAIDPQGQIHVTVQRLLEDPASFAEPWLKTYGASEVNGRARLFCGLARSTITKFPFDPNSTTQASIAEVTSFLRPGTGALWMFYNDVLQGMLQKQGNQYVPGAGGTKLTPEFVAFFNRAASLSAALFKDESAEPRFTFTITPQVDLVEALSMYYDGDVIRAARGGTVETATLSWPGAGRDVKLSVKMGGPEITLVGPYSGPWGVVQLFHSADSWQPLTSGDGYRVAWVPRTAGQGMTLADGSPLRITVELKGAPAAAVLRRSVVSGGACTGEIAR